MAVIDHATVVGVFADPGTARQAVQELLDVGFSEDQVGAAARHPVTDWEEGAARGAAAGAGVGALWALGTAAGVLPAVGPVVTGGLLTSVLTAAAEGAVAGGVVGALVGLGLTEEQARFYDGEFRAGRPLVTVRAPGRYEEAVDILRRHGAAGLP